ncbi:MAG: AbrB/MazE/SpoVT family DNA-binding domain-containing protein [Euryarchaeota archaeon]|nr:AbrB/MazE/SpoVT family DNA-binding domain-containing protein [Euryarchaeota archaeon]
METNKVTEKFQITIPKKVREEIGLKPGERVIVKQLSKEEILIKRFRRLKAPAKILIGTKKFKRSVPIEELEEKIERR